MVLGITCRIADWRQLEARHYASVVVGRACLGSAETPICSPVLVPLADVGTIPEGDVKSGKLESSDCRRMTCTMPPLSGEKRDVFVGQSLSWYIGQHEFPDLAIRAGNSEDATGPITVEGKSLALRRNVDRSKVD